MITRVQDGLNALASDTGGRFLKNTNALDSNVDESHELVAAGAAG